MMISAATHSAQVVRSAELLGVPLPKVVLDGLATAERVAAGGNQFATSTADLHAAVISAIQDDRDPHTDKTVQRYLLDERLVMSNIGESARAAASNIAAAVLVEHADDILEGWQAALAPDSAALTLAVDVLPTQDLEDAAAAIRAGGKTIAAWSGAVEAVSRFDIATTGFSALAALSGVNTIGRYRRVLLLVDVDVIGLEALDVKTSAPHAWDIACAGPRLDFPTLTEFRSRAAALDEQLRRRAAEAEERQLHPGRASVRG